MPKYIYLCCINKIYFVSYFRKPTIADDKLLDDLDWNPYNLNDKNYLNIGNTLEMKKNLYQERITFWDDFLEKWQKCATNGVIKNPPKSQNEEL